jgi:tRNA dimethylallyltransferase
MKKILVIVGPTGTGKTDLALHLAKKFKGEVVSADSRQVFIGMDIGTGKDIPEGSIKENTKWGTKYIIDGVPLWGYDLVDPKSGFNVSEYVDKILPIIEDIDERGKLPILTGGTGLFVKGIIDGIETSYIPVNEKLRENLKNRAVGELYEHLAEVNPIKAASMNSSDKMNSRRLIRAIEISQFLLDNHVPQKKENKTNLSPLFIGLTADKDILFERINKRVQIRINKGQEQEVSKLIKSGLNWDSQSMSSIGYRQWKEYFEGSKKLDEVTKEWSGEEKKYIKRQLTWFKRDNRINWFDLSSGNYLENVEKTVEKW